MPNFFPRRFANPETLKHVSKPNLIEFLSTAKDYLAGRGFFLPSNPAAELDYEALVGILVNPDADMPQALVDGLYFIHEMATGQAMLELLEDAPQGLLNFNGEEPTPADVALQLWLRDRDFLETKHAQQHLIRPKTFYFLQGIHGTPQDQPKVDPSAISVLQEELDDWFEKRRRGRGARMFVFPREAEKEVWFLVRHGLPMRREGTYEKGEPASVYYRPEIFDVLIYQCTMDALATHTSTKGERDLYQALFGKHIFGLKEYFFSGGNYRLDPLRKSGSDSLDCSKIAGIEWVRLKELEVFQGSNLGASITFTATDVFEYLSSMGMDIPHGFLSRASFDFKFADAKTPRSVTIRPPDRTAYTRDTDRLLVEEWMVQNEFLVLAESGVDEAAEATVGSD